MVRLLPMALLCALAAGARVRMAEEETATDSISANPAVDICSKKVKGAVLRNSASWAWRELECKCPFNYVVSGSHPICQKKWDNYDRYFDQHDDDGLPDGECECKYRPRAESQESKLDTVTALETQAFLGRWYQMYGSMSSTILTFGNAGPHDLCTSADYSLNGDGTTIDVLNQGIRLDGRITKIWGQAKATEEVGQKKLSFQKFLRGNETISPPDFEGDYWVYRLGPIINGKYEWAVVGSPATLSWLFESPSQLFVLVRDPAGFMEKYDDEVHEWLHANSFDWWWNRKRATGSVGKWQWFPYPWWGDGDGSRGEFGHDGCATVEELTPPLDGSMDPRT